MCRMARSRAEWYVSRGLAERVPYDDPRAVDAPGRTIKLTFTPNGRGNIAEPWQLQGKENVYDTAHSNCTAVPQQSGAAAYQP
jgi:hypothetical protein